jgi:hypothetical protein
MHRSRPFLASLLVAGALGCGGEALDLEGRSDAGGGAAGGADGGAGGAGGGGSLPPNVEPDREVFRTVVLPILDRRCSTAACHAGPPPREDASLQLLASPAHPVADLTDAEVDQDLAEVLAFVDFANPDASDILRYPFSTAAGDPVHSTPSPVFFEGSEEAAAIRQWIVDATREDEPDAGAGPAPMGPDLQVPCGALPDPAGVRGPDWYATFGERVEPMLTSTCTGSDCHSVPGMGGGYWLRTGGTECDRRWNFLMLQWHVDPVSPIDSRILQKPLDPLHGGREVFHGTSDPKFVLLKDWIVSGVTR